MDYNQVDGWLAARAQSFNGANGMNGVFQAAGNSSTTQMIINNLRFAAARSIRTSTIILAAFNAVAAFATALGILYDCYSTKKRNERKYKSSRVGLPFIPAPEIYPLILSVGITIQGIGFAVAQAQGLDSLLGRGCTLVSQLMLPAVFIVPYIQLIFGLEVTIRSLRGVPFSGRGKYTVSVCLVILGMLLLANFLVADFVRSPDLCFASLFWFVANYAVGCFALLLAIAVILTVCTAIIFFRLTQSTRIDSTERVAASRMIYYLALAILSNTLMIPFFFDLAFSEQGNNASDNALTLSMVASVVACVSGLMTGGLHLFLRSSSISTIGPKNKAGEYERQRMKGQIRRYNTDDSDMGNQHMMRPVNQAVDLRRMLSDASLISSSYDRVYDKEDEATLIGRGSPTYDIEPRRPNPLRSNAVYPVDTATMRAPEAAHMSSATSIARKLSYSLFPGGQPEGKQSITLLPATTYTPNTNKGRFDFSTLKPPPSIRNLAGGRHRRDSSMASSATVQIGLRLSNVEDMPPMNNPVFDQKVYALECPKEKEKAALAAKRPSPLTTSDLPGPNDEELSVINVSPKRDPVKDARMKTLPPVPRLGREIIPVQQVQGENEDDEGEQQQPQQQQQTLSPAVYNPQSPTRTKLPSPKGVGFTAPPSRSNSSAARSPPPRLTSGGSPRPVPGKSQDWI